MESVKSTIPEITEKTRNKVFRASESKNIPFLVLKKGRKYARIEYDFVGINYVLTNDAVEMLEKAFDNMIKLSIHSKTSNSSGN